MSDAAHSSPSQSYAASADHDGTHKDSQPQAVTGGVSDKGNPADKEDPKGESIPGFDPQNQPDFMYHKPGGNDGAGIVGKVMGSFAKGGNSSG